MKSAHPFTSLFRISSSKVTIEPERKHTLQGGKCNEGGGNHVSI